MLSASFAFWDFSATSSGFCSSEMVGRLFGECPLVSGAVEGGSGSGRSRAGGGGGSLQTKVSGCELVTPENENCAKKYIQECKRVESKSRNIKTRQREEGTATVTYLYLYTMSSVSL